MKIKIGDIFIYLRIIYYCVFKSFIFLLLGESHDFWTSYYFRTLDWYNHFLLCDSESNLRLSTPDFLSRVSSLSSTHFNLRPSALLLFIPIYYTSMSWMIRALDNYYVIIATPQCLLLFIHSYLWQRILV